MTIVVGKSIAGTAKIGRNREGKTAVDVNVIDIQKIKVIQPPIPK
jgi:hypothetical protein